MLENFIIEFKIIVENGGQLENSQRGEFIRKKLYMRYSKFEYYNDWQVLAAFGIFIICLTLFIVWMIYWMKFGYDERIEEIERRCKKRKGRKNEYFPI